MVMKKLTLIIITNLFTIAGFAGDILTLNNEMVFEGEVVKIKKCAVIFKAGGEKYTVPTSDIFSVRFGNVKDKVYTNFLELADDAQNKCLSGRLDAENYHGRKGGHFILGMLFGPFAIIGTAATANPTPLKGRDTFAMSKNTEILDDPEYLNCYKKKAKSKLIGVEGLGFGATIILLLFLLGPP